MGTQDRLVEIMQQPYQKHSPYSVIKHPLGRRLSWRWLRKVEDKGWGGWIPVCRGDGIFEQLDEYITESPMKYSNSADSSVVRGRSILCWKSVGEILRKEKDKADRANAFRKAYDGELANLPKEMRSLGTRMTVRTAKKDPRDIQVIMDAFGITEEDIMAPEADPRNRPTDVQIEDPNKQFDTSDLKQPPPIPVEKPKPKPRGRPKKG
jgi:hypothetical protein